MMNESTVFEEGVEAEVSGLSLELEAGVANEIKLGRIFCTI
jgi:hypothetical protein